MSSSESGPSAPSSLPSSSPVAVSSSSSSSAVPSPTFTSAVDNGFTRANQAILLGPLIGGGVVLIAIFVLIYVKCIRNARDPDTEKAAAAAAAGNAAASAEAGKSKKKPKKDGAAKKTVTIQDGDDAAAAAPAASAAPAIKVEEPPEDKRTVSPSLAPISPTAALVFPEPPSTLEHTTSIYRTGTTRKNVGDEYGDVSMSAEPIGD
ncbi:hypothetical protein DFJ73DRAFT_65924 [Zopfochytrium polystomum]|nr:hypothetical protein DFJ73DRAFT_65924 [Zopfochytrium polystomum]